MNNIKKILLVFGLLFVSGCSTTINNNPKPSGEDDNSVGIYTIDDLKKINSQSTYKYKLMKDITFNSAFTPIQFFNGEFDGNGHTISMLYNTSSFSSIDPKSYGIKSTALFTVIGENGHVHDLKFENCEGSTATEEMNVNAAILAGINKGKIKNVSFSKCRTSLVDGNGNMSGIVASQNESTGEISNVTIDGKSNIFVTRKSSTENLGKPTYGMIAGFNKGSIHDCVIHETTVTAPNGGGICGTNNGSINNVANILQVISVTTYYKAIVGGLVGENNGRLTNSYAFNSNITAMFNADVVSTITGFIGGVCGVNTNTMSHNYFEGAITSLMSGKETELSKVTDLCVAGICANSPWVAIGNFADCKIISLAQGALSIIQSKETGSVYKDIYSYAICFLRNGAAENRIQAKTLPEYHGYDIAVVDYEKGKDSIPVKFYNNQDDSRLDTTWLEFLKTKQFLDQGNYVVENLYPIINSELGYNYKGSTNYQNEVRNADQQSKDMK